MCKAYADPSVSPAGEANVAKITSLAVKAGALLVILVLPAQFTLDLQLFGGLWILQTLPTLIFGIYIGWFRAHGLIAGWVAGFSGGTWLAWVNNFKPLRTLYRRVTLHSGLLPPGGNIPVAIHVSAVLRFSTRGDR